MQKKHQEWHEQWSLFQDDELFLFRDWIYPNTLEDFKNKEVLECGCGGGQHTFFIAPYARSITAVDLNTIDIAMERNKKFDNVRFVEADIATMDLNRKFDIVFSIGVVHHTDNPDRAVENLKRHVKPGGKLILWVYSKEGNLLVRCLVEPIRKIFLKHIISNKKLLTLCKIITALLYIPFYSIYMLHLRFLPYYEYSENFRKLSFYRNNLNVFDKLNAPQVDFISKDRIERWFDESEFENIHIRFYKGVSWSGSGTKKCQK